MDISKNISVVREKMTHAAKTAARDTAAVTLVAVSKTHDEAAVRAAYAAGQCTFGENRVQEAKAKFTALKQEHPDIVLHLIGPLQTNKVDDAVRLFDVIETLDRPSLADALSKAIKKIGCAPQLYVEVNVGNEAQKSGVAPDELGSFLDYCRRDCGLEIDGLMCIPPLGEDPTPYFQHMKLLVEKFQLANLSMGMSGDFEAAIACGSTEVRIGTAIFGNR